MCDKEPQRTSAGRLVRDTFLFIIHVLVAQIFCMFRIVLWQFVAFENETFHFVTVQMVNGKGFLSVFFL